MLSGLVLERVELTENMYGMNKYTISLNPHFKSLHERCCCPFTDEEIKLREVISHPEMMVCLVNGKMIKNVPFVSSH
jgi:hypothetical protein